MSGPDPTDPADAVEVSIVIPSYGRPAFALRAVATAMASRGVDFEVVVIDDASEEPLTSVLEDAVDCSDGRCSVVRLERRSGVAEARNRGIAMARGRYVAFLDDDDLWAPDKLADQLAVLAETGARWSWCGAYVLDDELAIWWVNEATDEPTDLARLRETNFVGTPSGVIVERSLLGEVGGFDPAYSVLADWDLWLRLAEAAPGHPLTVPSMGYVVHPGSMHRDGLTLTVAELRQLRTKHVGGKPLGGREVWRWLAGAARDGDRFFLAIALYLWTAVRWWDLRALKALARMFLRVRTRSTPPRPDDPGWIARWRAAPLPALPGDSPPD